MRAPRLSLVVCLVMLGTLVPATPAHAQAETVDTTVSVRLLDPGQAIVPSRPLEITATVRYRWQPGAAASEPTEVYVSIPEHPDWAEAKMEPPVLLFPVQREYDPNPENPHMPQVGAIGGVLERQAIVNVTLKEGARAFDRQDLVVHARAEPNGNLQGGEAVSSPVSLMPAYAGDVNLTGPDVVRTRGGVPTTVEFTITNTGNGDSRIRFNVPLQPEDSILDETPDAIELGPGESETLSLTLRTPWTTSARGQLVVEATPIALEDEVEEGETVALTMEVEGLSAMPAPGLPLLLAALAGLALARRRR